MGNQVYTNKDNLTNMKNEIVQNGNELIELLDKLLLEVESTEEVYNTPSVVLFREKITEYINDRKDFINDHYLFFEDITNEIIKTYEEKIAYDEQMVGE